MNERGFPKKEEREEVIKAVEYNRKLADVEYGGYIYLENEWPVYDSSLSDFAETFTLVLPKDYGGSDPHRLGLDPAIFRKYIENTLSQGQGEQKHGLTAVEFGGPGSKLFSGFSKGFFIKTAGVCLRDERDQRKKDNDVTNNHSVLEGDIMDPTKNEVLVTVVETLGTAKTDLIISRMCGPLDVINKHPAILDRIIRNWYSMLNENGIIFVQFEFKLRGSEVPITDTENLVKKWVVAVKEILKIDTQIGDRGTLRLHKRKGALEKLPSATQLFRNT